MISTSGSGQMLPLPMNEFLQENLKEACDVDVEFDVVEWQVLLTVGRARRRQPEPARRDGAQRLLALVAMPASWRAISPSANFAPNGFNFEQWKDDKFEEALEGSPRRPTEGDRGKPIATRMSGWSTIRPGSTSSTTSTRAP